MLGIDYGTDGAVVFNGRLDAAQAFLDRTSGVVTLDCRSLEYISSAGLGVLLKTHTRLIGAAGRLRLTGVGPHLRDIFVYSGFDQLFEIEASG